MYQLCRFFLAINNLSIYIGYHWHSEDNPMCGEEGFYDPTSETEWPEEIINYCSK